MTTTTVKVSLQRVRLRLPRVLVHGRFDYSGANTVIRAELAGETPALGAEQQADRWTVSVNPGPGLNDSGIVLQPEPPPGCRVLLVDDDQLVIRRISSLLQRAGYEIRTASTGEEALRMLKTTVCQIVLTDWQMPDMDGLALCRNLRDRDCSSYIYILMLTVRDGSSDVVAGLAAGADDYVVKGATADEILARLAVGRRITHLDRSLRSGSREIERMSSTDALTGARNRRYLMSYLPRELTRSQRDHRPLAVVACDVDNFTRISAAFGRTAGDEILQSFVTRASNCMRRGIDWIARNAREEFIFVLPETNLSGARCVVERLHEVLAAHPISTSAGPIEITVSTGVTALETAAELKSMSSADLLRAVDRHLHTSKNARRDRATAARADYADALAETTPGVKRDTH